MTLAESMFQTAANDLVTGHILIKHLDLIIKHKKQFISKSLLLIQMEKEINCINVVKLHT